MLSQADLQIALAFALREFAPAWKIVSDCLPCDPLDPNHWASGTQSFQVMLRHRLSGQLKAIGRRVADEPDAIPHRGLALSVIEAYGHGNAEPLRRYLEEVGVAAGPARDAGDAAAPAAAPVVAPAEPLAAPRPIVSRGPEMRRAIRPTIPGSALRGSMARSAAPPPRGRMLSKLRRELQIWQWRRAVAADARKAAAESE
jgi:hypothetical protein